MNSKFRLLSSFLATGVLFVATPVVTMAQDAAKEPAAPAEDHTADFKTLTADFARLDKLYLQYTDPMYKLGILGYINLLKGRATALGWQDPTETETGAGGRGGRGGRGGPARGGAARGGGGGAGGYGEVAAGAVTPSGWDQLKYDELRYDINLQGQRLTNYMAPLRSPPPETRMERQLSLNLAKLNPSPQNPAEVKAALDALDSVIKKMEGRAAAMMIGSLERDAEVAKIARIKERRTALSKEFTQARWDALVGDLK